jgi:SAM-dependent methyltransferase
VPPPAEVFEGAYAAVEDLVSLREERGQVHTATRDLAEIERHAAPGRLLDVGCWTGSLLVASAGRGWVGRGVEPSRWAVARARERGCDVQCGTIEDLDLGDESFEAVVACDVVEHVVDPLALVERLAAALVPGGILFLTVPDAGSRLASILGRRWWSVLPMHLQYFTRTSMRALLGRAGLDVRSIHTHPKAFSAGYYAERLAAFLPVGGGAVTAVCARLGFDERLVAPDLHDRLAVIVQKAPRRG